MSNERYLQHKVAQLKEKCREKQRVIENLRGENVALKAKLWELEAEA